MVIYGVYIYGSGQVAKYIEVPSAEARQSPCGQNWSLVEQEEECERSDQCNDVR
jgi:hypothetical protein